MENNEIKEENVNEEVEKKNKKKTIRNRIILIIVIIAIIIIALSISVSTSSSVAGGIIINGSGIQTDPGDSWGDDVSVYEDSSLVACTMYVPIPDGYVVSEASDEDTVAEGLVIYEGTERVTDSNVETAKKTRNQWVWVPVDPDEVYYEDENGVKYSVYHTWDEDATSMDEGLTSDRTKTLEPYIDDYFNIAYEDEWLDTYYSDEDSIAEIYTEMRQNYEEMIASIEKYGGFYIGRYELGDNETTTKRDSTADEHSVLDTPVVMQGKWPYTCIDWYQAYNLCSDLGANDTVKTNMMYDTLWDNTLIALIDAYQKTYSEIAEDSLSWGNYYESSFTYTSFNGVTTTKTAGSAVVIPTGNSDYCKANNIYDLAGNIMEFTMGNPGINLTMISRGGHIGGEEDAGIYLLFRKVTYRNTLTAINGGNSMFGTRPILYIR